MKIAILTLNLNSNYGGLLQCYALQTVLERMGHEVKVLSAPRYKWTYFFIYPLSCIKRFFKKIFLWRDVDILHPLHQIINKNIYDFIDHHINVTTCIRWNKKLAEKYDVIIVGSDQVWRPDFTSKIEHFFLDFAESTSIKRVAYAASFGVDNPCYTETQIRRCSSLLKQFDAVSVREISGVDICSEYFGTFASLMPDPTLLLDRKDYSDLINTDDVLPYHGDLLVYFLDSTDEKEAILKDLMKETGLLSFYVNANAEDEDVSIKQKIYPRVTQWLQGFQQAKFVITDSFHGCVFSIIYNKPFIAIGNVERGLTRFISLLQNFGLQNRLISSVDEYNAKKNYLLSDINHDLISSICNSQKEKGLLYLENELNKVH